MRGHEQKQSSMLCLLSPADRVPTDHPLRELKRLVDAILKHLSPVFDDMYSAIGRPSIPPESLLKSSLLMALYSVRSERQFCEQLDYNLLFRWFLDMDMLAPSFDASTFSKNRERLLSHHVAEQFFQLVVESAKAADLMSSEHFTVDGTLLEACASLKSFSRREQEDKSNEPPDDRGNPSIDFHGEKRSNATHVSKTDPEAKLIRKGRGKEAKLVFNAHALMENRNGLLVDIMVTEATGRSEIEAAEFLLKTIDRKPRITLGADKGYDVASFIASCREANITPHIAAKKTSSLDARTTRHAGYAVSQKIRKRVEEIFGWMKTVGNFRRTRYRGIARTELAAYMVGAAYNLIRLVKLIPMNA